MNKKLKAFIIILIAIIVIFVVLILINVIRNNSILNKIYNSNEELEASLNNYYFESNSDLSEGETRNTMYKIYNNGDKYIIEDYYNDGLVTTEWADTSAPEYLTIDHTTGERTEEDAINFKDMYKRVFLSSYVSKEDSNEIIMSNLVTPIKVENNCYVIEENDNVIYVDVNTCKVSKIIFSEGNVTTTYKLKNNSVTEDEVVRPE